MAIASGAFMAAPGGFTEVYLSTKLDKIDCSQVLAAVLKADRQLLGHIKMGAVAHNVEFNWIEDELNAVTFEAMSPLSISISIFSFILRPELHQSSTDAQYKSNHIVLEFQMYEKMYSLLRTNYYQILHRAQLQRFH